MTSLAQLYEDRNELESCLNEATDIMVDGNLIAVACYDRLNIELNRVEAEIQRQERARRVDQMEAIERIRMTEYVGG